MIPNDCYHVRLRFRVGMTPSITTVYIAFTEAEAYRWIDERHYPAAYTVYVKPVARRAAAWEQGALYPHFEVDN